MKALKAMYLSQAMLFVRSPVTVILTLLVPVMLGGFFVMLFRPSTSENTQTIRIIVVDEDQHQNTRLLIENLLQTTEKGLTLSEATTENALAALKKDDADAVMIFPQGSGQAAQLRKQAVIRVYYSPYRMESAAIARQIAEIIVSEINIGLARAQKAFITEVAPVSFEQQQPSLGEFYLPNFLAISVLWSSLFATALPLVKQREQKIFLRLGATPLSPVTFMAAMVLWRLTLGIAQSLIFLAMGVALLRVNLGGQIVLFGLAILAGNLSFIAMGLMIAAVSQTMQTAEVICQIINFVMMFLSGSFFQANMLPKAMQMVAYALPLSYLADLYRQLMVGYQGFAPLWVGFAVIAGSGVVCAGIALKCWRWR